MRRFIFLLCVLLLVLPYSAFAQQQLPPVNPAAVTGNIAIAGSTILAPVTNNIVTRFTLEGYTGNISVNTNGTATAIQQLCAGEVDIVMADRQILPQEVDACTGAGRPPIAFRVATSAVVVTVSAQNQFAGSMTSAELQQAFSTALSWSDVRAGWPGDPINRFGPATDSPEFDLFATVLFGGNRSPLATAIGAQYTDDQGGRLQSIATSNNAIGFFEANFALANFNVLRGVTIDNISPTTTTIADNTYPLSRPLLIYTTSQEFTQDPQVTSFLNFYLSNIEFETNAVGLFPPPATALEVARSRWISASGQSAPVPAATEDIISIQPTAGQLDPIAATATALASTVGNEPTATPDAGPTEIFQAEVQNLLLQARLDLELVAQEIMQAERPVGWSGSLDIQNPQLPLLVRLDLELIAAQVYGLDSRPDDWFGAVSSTQEAISRDIRHDLELLADDVFALTRPENWAGADPIYSCDRATQALATLLQKNGLYTLTANPASPEYCMQVAIEVSRFVEVNLLSSNVAVGQGGVTIPGDVTIETTIAVAFYTRSATQRAGVIPAGTGVTPIARSYQGFSNMTLIEGPGFLVFVEWQNTSLTQDEWQALPNEAELEFTATCSAEWCESQG